MCRTFYAVFILVLLFSSALIFDGVGIAQLLERRTRDRKVVSSNPGRTCGTIFFPNVSTDLSAEMTFCADSYTVYAPPLCSRIGT